jgi:DNA-binding SARP family transcriptional activator
MEFRLLGPVGVLRDGVVLPLPRRKQRALLAALLLRPGETVPVDRLVDQLWGGRAPATAVGSLHNLVSQLRRVLGEGVIVTRPPGYAFEQPRELVDLWEFERLLAAGRPREALALWRGPALADLEGEPLAEDEAPLLEERRLLAWEALFERDLEAGRGGELVADLERLVAEHPRRERFTAQLMRALYQAGRQADALEAYQRTRAALDERGIEPSRALRDLQTAILRQDSALGEGASVREAPARRRTVTVVAASLAHSPDDPEAYVTATRGLHDSVAAVAERHAARALEATAVFGDPQQREDDVIRAVRAALDLAADGARVALATGEVIASAERVDGAPVARALGLARAAVPGEVLAAPSAVALLGAAVRLEPVESVDGVVPSRVVSLEPGVLTVPRAHAVPLVGRVDELDRLIAAARSPEPAVVTVVGEAGVGKTRVATELAALLEPDVATLVGRCPPYGEGPVWAPVVEALGPEVAARLDGVTPGEAAHAVAGVLEERARERPLVLVLEDVHWAQPSLLDLVEFLRRRPPRAPVLVLALARPELLEHRPGWADAETVRLEPLGDDEARTLLDRLGSVDGARARVLVATAGGNPLFLEQLVAHVEEQRQVDRIPPSIDALLAARLDALAVVERATLERAAVVGPEFARETVAALSDWPVDAPLLSLLRRGLLEAARDRDRLRFHHALVREAAYAAIARQERAAMHEALAERLADAAPELVGHHLERAHADRSAVDPRDPALPGLAERAGRLLTSAGIAAWKRTDAAAAAELLARGVALLPRDDLGRAEAMCELGLAARAAGGGNAALEDAVEAARLVGDRRLELRAGLELARAEGLPSAEFLERADEAVSVFEAAGDDRALGRALLLRGAVIGAERGRNADWARAAERAAAHLDRAAWPPWWCYSSIGAALFHGPVPVPRAIRRCKEMLAQTPEGTVGRAELLLFLAGLTAMRGDFLQAGSLLDEADDAVDALGLVRVAAQDAADLRATVELLAGNAAGAAEVLARSCDELERLADPSWLATRRARLADVLVALGRDTEARRLAGLARAEGADDDLPTQFLWRSVQARLDAAAGDHAAAARLVGEALELVDATDGLNQRAEVALAAAAVASRAGHADEARAHTERAGRLYRRKANLAALRLLGAR